ncbi:MAG: hypothetical protein ACP5O2_10005 [Bacteroidales bacterium]
MSNYRNIWRMFFALLTMVTLVGLSSCSKEEEKEVLAGFTFQVD